MESKDTCVNRNPNVYETLVYIWFQFVAILPTQALLHISVVGHFYL